MCTRPFLKAALALYVLWGAWHWYVGRPVHPPDGVLAGAEPEQTDLAAGATPIRRGRWTLTARAHYRVTARVLATEQYRFDAIADLTPQDVALGWGPMSDNRVLAGIDISQDNRFYFWRARRPVLPREVIVAHSANTHLIPTSQAVARLLERLRPGEVVTLRGELVDGRRDDGLRINTSLSRTDQGAGACEVLLVTDVSR